MTRLVYQSQTHPSHDKVRDGIQDLGYKMSIDGRFCFRLSIYVSGFVQSCQSVFVMVLEELGRSQESSRGMLIGAMIRFPISRILANVRGQLPIDPAPPITHYHLFISSHPFPIINSLLSSAPSVFVDIL